MHFARQHSLHCITPIIGTPLIACLVTSRRPPAPLAGRRSATVANFNLRIGMIYPAAAVGGSFVPARCFVPSARRWPVRVASRSAALLSRLPLQRRSLCGPASGVAIKLTLRAFCSYALRYQTRFYEFFATYSSKRFPASRPQIAHAKLNFFHIFLRLNHELMHNRMDDISSKEKHNGIDQIRRRRRRYFREDRRDSFRS